VLVTKPHNKTPDELLHGRTPSISFMRSFGCPVTILNTLDLLGKFQGNVDEGFLVGYFICSKAFRVFNSRTRIIQETLHVNFLENKPNVAGTGPTWLFDSDSHIMTINYQPVHAGNQTNSGLEDIIYSDEDVEEPKRVKQKNDGIFISQDKYVAEILRKFGLIKGKSASTPIDTEKPLLKDPNGENLTQTVTMLVQAWTENVQLEDVNSLDADSSLGSARSRKFNFSKYNFKSLVRNVDNSSKFYMYPRFIQLIIQNQLGDLSTHTTKYTSPALTQKVFANMRRVGKGFSGVETPLFEGMLVAGELEEQGDAEEYVQDDVDDAAQGADTAVQRYDVHKPSILSPTLPTPPPQQS
nr:retrovirus-related Pol polyprotein from transposon TNT 1-94 [Tanacetum cinerariifolium]